MPVNLHVRNVPDGLHRTLVARARDRGVSLRRYVLEVLAEHEALPSLDQWLDGIARLSPVELDSSGAEAVHAAREADEVEIVSAVARS